MSLRWVFITVLLVLVPFFAFSETETVKQQLNAIDPWLDGYMDAHLEAYWIPGAAVAVVTDERSIIRGYGFRDPIAGTPVDPQNTMFRIASITKTFTWAAVMALVQEGTLDLDRDISYWVDSSVFPATGRPEITLRDLITHTAGFEDTNARNFETQLDATLSNRDFISAVQPEIAYHPGEFPAYSNYGAALAGFVIESAVGTSWEEWIRTTILEPAAMDRGVSTEQSSAFLESGAVSSGWEIENGVWVEEEHYGFNGPAAGGMSATADAMAKWLHIFVNGGEAQNRRVLREATVEQMIERRDGYHRELGPTYYGFMRRDNYGLQILGHGGNFGNHISTILIYPELGVGLFVAYNRHQPAALSDFVDSFTRYIQAHPTPAIGTRPDTGVRASHSVEEFAAEDTQPDTKHFDHDIDLDGYYLPTRNNYSTIEKVTHLYDAARVTLHPNGVLEVGWLDSGGSSELTPIGESVWRTSDEGTRIAARETPSGETVLYVQEHSGTWAMRKLSAIDFPPLHVAGFVVTFLVFGFTMFWIPFAPLIGCRSCDKPRRKARRLVRFIIWLLSFVGIPGVAIVIWFVLFGEGYLFEDPVTTRILTFSNSLVFIVLGVLVITTALTRRYHPLGSKSIPFLTRAIIGVGFFYTFLVLWWNLVPWKMV
ncbi:MAG: serine hydrolase [Spirochaeta sp.]|nr:serine hydrolase [Spirochaeta sp.]